MVTRILSFALALGLLGIASGEAAPQGKSLTPLERKQQIFPEGDLFRIFKTPMSEQEREAMAFLYAYMPANDLIDYSGEFYLRHVRSSLQARQEMPWGSKIPDREWRHFVLPVRVNNETLDSARMVFYDALKDRVKGLSLYDAVLEVNHWCHEHVVYTPSDSRTSSPLATIRTAYGRCGEESTLLVAALRAVGIPARQVYTPRWAHTDDNHAWVEAWVDGRWHFLGACEPEPVLDLGWFNAPVSRAMLVHTKVFGHYDGPEDVMSRTPTYTEINVIGNYAHTSPVEVEVVDEAGRPQSDVLVEFKVYNYGEFYSVATKRTDKRGRTSLTAGRGDMLIYASKPEGSGYRYGMRQVSFGQDKTLRLVLKHQPSDKLEMQLTVTPPREDARYPEVTEAQRVENNRRMAQEDSIRNAYVSTFLDKQLEGLDARGNWQTLKTFVEAAKDRTKAIALLRAISAKDLRDVELATLQDHLEHTQIQPAYRGQDELQMAYIYNPRVANEMITPYKRYFQEQIPLSLQLRFKQSPEQIRRWCLEHIQDVSGYNPLAYPIQPRGVWVSRRADAHSLGIFFVALARSMGWPARIDGVTGKVQCYTEDRWQDVSLAKASSKPAAREGALRLSYEDNGIVDNPKYYYHFSISKFGSDRRLSLLNYDEGDNGLEQGSNWAGTFKNGAPMDEGQYLLVSGSRLANGSVLVDMKTYTIESGQTTDAQLTMRRDTTAVAVLGSFNSENLYKHLGDTHQLATTEAVAGATGQTKSILSTTGRGYYILGVLGAGQEPTNHALRDIIAERELLESWGQKMLLVFSDEVSRSRYRAEDFKALPKTATLGVDIDGKLLAELRANMKLKTSDLPVFVIADTFNRVVFISQGYTIGLGRQLRSVITALEADRCPTPTRTCAVP